MTRYSTLFQSITAIGALTIGILVYTIDRQPTSVYFIPDWLTLANRHLVFFGSISNYLPTFIHVYVFIMFSAVVIGPGTRILLICITWCVIDSLFELAQLHSIGQWIAGHVPSWFTGIPFLENTSAYFSHGTFDYLDLISIAVGTLLAYLTLLLSFHGSNNNVPNA